MTIGFSNMVSLVILTRSFCGVVRQKHDQSGFKREWDRMSLTCIIIKYDSNCKEKENGRREH